MSVTIYRLCVDGDMENTVQRRRKFPMQWSVQVRKEQTEKFLKSV